MYTTYPAFFQQRSVTEDPTLTVTSVFCFCFFPSVFCFRCVSLMDPLLRLEFLLLLLLEQGERSLEDHTRLFLVLAHTTSYLDDALCSFYDASLTTACRALSSEDDPRADFAVFVEWILARNGSPLTVWQPLCSPSAHLLYGASSAGLPSSSIAGAGVSLDSASSLRGPDSASAH